MRRTLVLALAALPLAACASQTTDMASAPAPVAASAAPQPAALADLVAGVDIPYEQFTLANGLTVLVHTDRKAPIVGVTTHYKVGSKNEPRGRTGFAHLFEHLMFGGSENVENFDIPLEAAGSTSTNGSTWYDRTKLRRGGADRRARPGADDGKRPDGAFAGRGHSGQAR